MSAEQLSIITLLMGVVVVIAIYLVTTLRLELRRKTGAYGGLKTIIRNIEKEKNTQDLQRQFTPCKEIEYEMCTINKKTGWQSIRRIRLPETHTEEMLYNAVMLIIKGYEVYWLCPHVKKMITPKGLEGRTYKIWIEG